MNLTQLAQSQSRLVFSIVAVLMVFGIYAYFTLPPERTRRSPCAKPSFGPRRGA